MAIVGSLDPLALQVQEQYEAAFTEKETLGLHDHWAEYEDYWRGEQNAKQAEEHPGSVTNIVMPTIESMVSDLVMEPLEISLKGWQTQDRAVAPKAQLALEWVWEKNRMELKRDRFERQRHKFGTGIWKVYFDGQAMGMVGMPVIEPVNPANFFPDPKIRSHEQLHMADFIIHAVPRPLNYVKRIYGAATESLMADPNPGYDPQIFGEDKSAYDKIAQDKVLVLERWTIEKDGHLRKVVVANLKVLYDSDKDTQEERRQKGYFALNRYPFVVVPCYQREGMLWGLSEVAFLKPTQDLINDLDDQIRMNARLMGNIQKVISIASGINPNLWTNTPGLNIPARDINGYRIVEPPNMPPYILQRRDTALNVESQIISGRTDVVEGRRPGSLRAASAIIALQEAGLRRVNHKKMMSQQGLNEVFSIVLDFITEYWDAEIEIGEEVLYGDDSQPVWFSGRELREIPILTSEGIPLLDETGQPMTRRAQFDVTVNIGAGFVNNKSYIYQATLELVQYGLITREEGRLVLKQILSWPMIDPYNPVGEFVAQNGNGSMSPGQSEQAQNVMPEDLSGMLGQQTQGEIPPEILNELVLSMGGSPGA